MQTDPFSTLGFQLRADGDNSQGASRSISINNVQINGVAVGGDPLVDNGQGFLRFQSDSLTAADFASGFTLTGDVTMSWDSNFSGRPNARLGFDILGAGTAGAVPEPATWAMMVLGLGAAGGMMRTRRRRVAFAA